MKSLLSLRLLLAALASAGAFGLTSCHTAAGLGADVQHAGRGIQRTAQHAHP